MKAEVSAEAVREQLGLDVSLEPGSTSQFDVMVGEEIVASKVSRERRILFLRLDVPKFPTPSQVVEAVRRRIPAE